MSVNVVLRKEKGEGGGTIALMENKNIVINDPNMGENRPNTNNIAAKKTAGEWKNLFSREIRQTFFVYV